jgi:hypothetical protein
MFNLESTIAKIELQVTTDDDRQSFLRALKARLAERLRQEAELATLTNLTGKKSAESSESTESAFQPEPLRTEQQVSANRSLSLGTEPGSPTDAPEPPDNAKNFAAALDKLDPALRAVASDLYEQLHEKSKFARLSSPERDAIVELLRVHTCERVVEIIAQPPPLGLNLRTSRPGISRFRDDYIRAAMDEQKRRRDEAAEQQRLAMEAAFNAANASDNAFRKATETQIRKRLFQVAHDPASDFHEIRWLIRSLEMLKPAQPSPP